MLYLLDITPACQCQASKRGTTVRVWLGALCFSVLVCGGCANLATHADVLPRFGLRLYAPFDNARDWGPSYLVGLPRRSEALPNQFHLSDHGTVQSRASLNELSVTFPLPPMPGLVLN